MNDDKHKFILYESIEKTFHLVKTNRIVSDSDIEKHLNVLRKLTPELKLSDKVIEFEFKGIKHESILDLLKYYKSCYTSDIYCSHVYYQCEKDWKYIESIIASYKNKYNRNIRKPRINRIRLKDYIFQSLQLITYSIGEDQRIGPDKDPSSLPYYYRPITIENIPTPCYTEVKKIIVKFSNGVNWEFDWNYNIYEGRLLKINEVTQL